jgi:hypothetical protein
MSHFNIGRWIAFWRYDSWLWNVFPRRNRVTAPAQCFVVTFAGVELITLRVLILLVHLSPAWLIRVGAEPVAVARALTREVRVSFILAHDSPFRHMKKLTRANRHKPKSTAGTTASVMVVTVNVSSNNQAATNSMTTTNNISWCISFILKVSAVSALGCPV